MAKEYLDKLGLSYFWQKIKAYVDAHLGVAAYYQKNEGTYTTTSANESTIAIPIATYSSKDMLFVDINGLDLIGGTDYTISGTNIILTTPITTAGTVVHFVAIRAVTADPADYGSLKGDPGNVQDVLLNGSSVVDSTGVAKITNVVDTNDPIVYGHSSPIGTIKYDYLSSETSIPNNTYRELCSVSLDKGVWIINAGVRWNTNTNGTREANIYATSGANEMQLTVLPIGGNWTQMNLTKVVTVTADGTPYYLNARQTSGGALSARVGGTNYGTYITAVRIA